MDMIKWNHPHLHLEFKMQRQATNTVRKETKAICI